MTGVELPAPPGPTREPGPRIRTALLIGLVGIIVTAVGAVMIGKAFWDVVNSTVYRVPGTVRLHLESGEYYVYEIDTDGGSRTPTVDDTTLRVSGPGGARVPVFTTRLDTTITNSDGGFTSVVRFDAPSDGTYTLEFTTPRPTTVLITHPLGELARDNAGWGLLILAGMITLAIAFVLFVVGLFRRSASRKRDALPPAAPTPLPATVAAAGWYPDPSGTYRVRYWDGRTWTEHVAD